MRAYLTIVTSAGGELALAPWASIGVITVNVRCRGSAFHRLGAVTLKALSP